MAQHSVHSKHSMKSKFHIGQRVRRTKGAASLPKGITGTIIHQAMGAPEGGHPPGFYHIVRWDGVKNKSSKRVTPAWRDCWSEYESSLEPIYDGDQKIEWADCIWQPKSLEAV